MEYRNFQLKIFLRIGLIFLSLLILVMALTGEQNYVTVAVFSILVILEILELFRFVNRINREVEQFVSAIRNGDLSMNYNPERSGKIFRSLRIALGELMNDIQDAKQKEEMQNLYLQMLVDHIDTSIILFDRKMEVKLQNQAAVRIFSRIRKIDDLEKDHWELTEFIRKGMPGERKLYEKSIKGRMVHFAARKSIFLLRSEEYQLISMQDIYAELDAKEIDSWYRLIRVLTHEIMNTVTPVNSLSEAMLKELEEIDKKGINTDLEDVILSARTIYDRSRDLMKFISDYKKLTRTRKPELEPVILETLVLECIKLFDNEFKTKGIHFEIENLAGKEEIQADRGMIMRVLINLIRNSIEALENEKDKRIKFHVSASGKSKIIAVEDNGVGIPQEHRNDIFIPFFSTREKGSGIGLSLSRQIMHWHEGSIYLDSEPGKGSCFKLVFP